MSRVLTLRPGAKINLTLRVGPRRDDGYHDVRTVLQSIGLSDTLAVSPRRGPFALSCRAPGVPADRENLVWKAAERLWRSAGREGDPRDAHVKLEKSVPSAAGLGGGSADAAAALVALNVVWDLGRGPRALFELAASLGADVPFFLMGGTALGLGRGDDLYPVDDITRFGVVVIKPSIGVATADAYRWMDEDRRARPSTPATTSPRARDVEVGWPSGPLALGNDLEAPVGARHPVILEVVEACYREGAIAAAMTGSGAAVFGLYRESVAPRAAVRLRRPDWLVLVTRTLARREAARGLGLSGG